MSSSSVPKAGLIRVRKAWGEVDTRLWSRQEQREVQRISQAGAQAAEKGQLSGKSCKKHASGAKACGELPTLCGVDRGKISERYNEYHKRVPRLRKKASFRGNPAKSMPPGLKPAVNCRHYAGLKPP